MGLQVIEIEPKTRLLVRVVHDGVATYAVYLYKPSCKGKGWSLEKVVTEDGRSEDAGSHTYEIGTLDAGERRLIFLRSVVCSVTGGGRVEARVEVLSGDRKIGEASWSDQVTTGAKQADVRLVIAGA